MTNPILATKGLHINSVLIQRIEPILNPIHPNRPGCIHTRKVANSRNTQDLQITKILFVPSKASHRGQQFV
ncbi:hypothetical protein FOBRF1_003503 [Fusarium oxysporum]